MGMKKIQPLQGCRVLYCYVFIHVRSLQDRFKATKRLNIWHMKTTQSLYANSQFELSPYGFPFGKLIVKVVLSFTTVSKEIVPPKELM